LYDQLDFVLRRHNSPFSSSEQEQEEREKYFEMLIAPLLRNEEEPLKFAVVVQNNSGNDKSNNNQSSLVNLFSLIMKTLAWYQLILDGTPQQVRFKVVLCSLSEILNLVVSSKCEKETESAIIISKEQQKLISEKLFPSIKNNNDDGKSENYLEQLSTLVEMSFLKDKGLMKLKEFGDMQN
jgi:hypothetical protein